jgi:hypothetical protein
VLSFIISFYDERDFVVTPRKTVRPITALRVLGVWMDFTRGVVHPVPSKWADLYRQIPLVAGSSRPVPRHVLESLLGKLVWGCLIRRPLLSVFANTYRQLQQIIVAGPARLWGSVRAELMTMWALLPAMVAAFADYGPFVVASDATGSIDGVAGVGVAYSRSLDVPSAVAVGKVVEPAPAWWPAATWKWAVSSSFNSRAPVHSNEMVALLVAAKVAVSHAPESAASRLLCLVDNQVVVGSVNKGRSSSSSLNLLLRRWCAFLLHTGMPTPRAIYIHTSLNPADAPSRRFKLPLLQ